MMMILALAVMITATLAQHLGLTGAIARTLTHIAGCHMCCSFWSVLGVLLLAGCPVVMAAGLAMSSAYLSHWLALLLIILSKKYNDLWQRVNKRKPAGRK